MLLPDSSPLVAVVLLCGFSVGAALLLALAFASVYRGLSLPQTSRLAGYAMLLGLALTQLGYVQFLLSPHAELVTRSYVCTLFLQTVSFYYLLLGVLRPQQQQWRVLEWAVLPLALAGSLLAPLVVAVPLAMALGTGAVVHLGSLLWKLRAQRRWFQLEIRVLAHFAVMAVLIAGVSFAAPLVGWRTFATLYATLISASFLLIVYLLLRFPDIASKTEEAVAVAYATSTLSRVDCARAVSDIKRLLADERLYADENLNLNQLAEAVQLSAHQLSELINTEFGMGFSRLVRKYRVEAAQKMLIDEPRASVLSVGLSVGFTSQSNFYVAFKEITGVVPGQFRKQVGAGAPSSVA